jgi:uncharacterized membrane protein YoaK (UPF0700 family)
MTSSAPVTAPGGITQLLVLACLTWSMGVVDAFAFDTFGVFTTNQAGNLVVFADAPWDDWSKSRLAGLSLLGAACGVVVGTAVSGRLRDANRMSLLAPLLMGVFVLLVAVSLTMDGTRPAWLVPVMAAATGCIAGGWMAAGAFRMWLTANTGAFLATVHAVAFAEEDPAGGPRRRFVTAAAKAAAAATIGFVAGVATYGIGAADWSHPVLVGLGPVVVAVMILARRAL